MEEQRKGGLAIRWQGRRCTHARLGLVSISDYFIVASGNDPYKTIYIAIYLVDSMIDEHLSTKHSVVGYIARILCDLVIHLSISVISTFLGVLEDKFTLPLQSPRN